MSKVNLPEEVSTNDPAGAYEAPPGEEGTNAVKDPSDWTTGNEPMTGAQKSYLKTLSDQAGEEFDDSLSKADASRRIDELQQKTGRGADS
jgi:hypothetical protein